LWPLLDASIAFSPGNALMVPRRKKLAIRLLARQDRCTDESLRGQFAPIGQWCLNKMRHAAYRPALSGNQQTLADRTSSHRLPPCLRSTIFTAAVLPVHRIFETGSKGDRHSLRASITDRAMRLTCTYNELTFLYKVVAPQQAWQISFKDRIHQYRTSFPAQIQAELNAAQALCLVRCRRQDNGW
jgi:hypothetical protein